MRRLYLLLLVLILCPYIAKAQNGYVTVTGIIKDPTGALYVNSQVGASFIDLGTSGKLPLLYGSTFQQSYTGYGTDSFAHFSMSVADTQQIASSSGATGTQWRFTILYQDRQTSFTYQTPIDCIDNIPVTCNNGVMDISAPLQAVAALLPISGGGGFTSINVPFSTTPTFASNTNATFNFTLTNNVTSSFFVTHPPVNLTTVFQFNICQDNIGGHVMIWPNNVGLPPNYTFDLTAMHCSPVSFIYNPFLSVWTPWQTMNSSGGGGGNPSVGNQGTGQVAGSTPGTFNAGNYTDLNGIFNINEDTQSKGPNLRVDARTYGMRAIPFNSTPAIPGCTASINSGSTSATLNSACGLQTGDGIDIWLAGPTNTMSTPVAPTVTPSIAQGATGSGYVVNGPTGSASYGYEIVAIDAGQGVTAASPAGTTSTGAATLGAVGTVNITSQSRSNNTTTVTTSSAHGLPVGCADGSCPLVYIGSSNSLTDIAEFGGWFIVNSVADTTHFTYPSGNDTRFGVNSTTSTGGTLTIFNTNHLQLPTSNPSGVRQYAIYGRNCPTTCNLIGISMPVSTVITSDPTYMAWDDFGSTMMGNATFPAWLPTTAPSSATNDTLVTTIASGGGTTSITTSNSASNSVGGSTILIDNGPGLLACVSATNNTGGECYIPIPTSSILNKYVINSYTNIAAINNYALISQAGNLFLNDTIVWGDGQWHGDIDITSGNGSLCKPSFAYEGHPCITVNQGYPGLFIKTAGTFRGLSFTTNAANLYNEIFVASGNPMLFEDDVWGGGTGADLMGVEFYYFAPTGGGFGGNFRNFTFTTSTPSSATATPLFLSKNTSELNFNYGSSSNRCFTFIAGSNGGTNVLWNMGEENQEGSCPLLTFMSRGVGGSISWVSGSLDTDSQAGVANWSASATPQVSFSGPGSGTSGGFAFLTGRPFSSVSTGGVLSLPLLGQNFNLSAGATGIIYDGQTNSSNIELQRINQAIGPNYSVFTDPGVPTAPTCTTITAGPPFPSAGTYTFFYNVVYQNGGQGLTSPASNGCTVDGSTQQITVNYSTIPGATSYIWTFGGGNFPNVNGVNCVHTTSPPTTSWTYEGGSCGFESLPNFPGGGPAGLTGIKSWSNIINLGQYMDVAGTAAPANPPTGTGRWYFDSGTGLMSCRNSFGTSCAPSGGSGPTIQVNSTNTSSQTLINMINSVTNAIGATLIFSNPAGGQIKAEISGVINATGGGCGVSNPTAHTIPIAEGSSNCNYIGPGKTGQIVSMVNGGDPQVISSVLSDSSTSPVTTTPYLIRCDSATSLLDRLTTIRAQSGASVFTIPLSSASGCGGMVVGIVNDNAATLTFNVTSPDTVTVITGLSPALDSQTSFTLGNGQYVRLSQNATGLWLATLETNVLGSAHNIEQPLLCLDVSGSGTTQSCSTNPTFAPSQGDTIIYKTTTTNTGDLTINVNSSSAVHVRKWLGTATLVAGDWPAGVYGLLTYDGTYWETYTIGNAPAGGGGPCTTTANALQYDNAGVFGCVPDFTFSSPHTITMGASGLLDLSAGGATALKVPVVPNGLASSAGAILYDSTNKNTKFQANGADAIACAFAAAPTNGDLISATVASGNVLCGDSNVSAANTVFTNNKSDVLNQGISQSSVILSTSPSAGLYRIHYYTNLNTPCTTGANTVSFTFNWTDAGNARSLTTGNLSLGSAQTTSEYMEGMADVWVASGNVTYTSTIAGSCASGTSSYDIHARLEKTP